jgi:hypothetical protein
VNRVTARPTAATRASALLALGALAVHELRYVVAYGGHAQSAMATQGHGYLGELAPALVVLALSALCGRLAAASLGRQVAVGASRPVGRSATAFAAALMAIFAAQELVEGALFAGHAAGVAAVLGSGGWVALPLALGFGLLAALADRLLAGTERILVRRAAKRRRLPRPNLGRGLRPGTSLRIVAPAPLALGSALRAPPARSVS